MILFNKMIRHSNVLPCPTIRDLEAPYIIVNLPTSKYKVCHKFIRNLKKFNLESYKNNLKFYHLQLYTLLKILKPIRLSKKMFLGAIDKHADLVQTYFTRPPAAWMKDIEINHLQYKRVH